MKSQFSEKTQKSAFLSQNFQKHFVGLQSYHCSHKYVNTCMNLPAQGVVSALKNHKKSKNCCECGEMI